MRADARTALNVVALAGMLCAPACSKKEETKPREVIRPVRTMVVKDSGSTRSRSFTGAARAAVETALSFRVGGEVIDLPAKVGMPVTSGALIARLDGTDYELKVKQLEAQIHQVEAQLQQAKSAYARVRELYESGNTSKSNLDSGRAAFESTKAQKDALGNSLELARQQHGYCELKAPIDGVITSRPVDIHQTVGPGQVIATLSSGQQLEMEIGLPEMLIARVRVGDTARIRFEAVPGETFEARVSEVAVEPSASATYPVKLSVGREDSRIRAGMVGEATLSFGVEGPDALYVPAVAAVGNPDGTHHVWIFQKEPGAVTRRAVQVGALTSEGLQILEGVSTGEIVVTRGVHRLQEGMAVRLLEE